MRRVAVYLLRHEIWPVALGIALSVLSARLLPVALAVAGLFWVLRLVIYRRLSAATSADWGIGLLTLMAAVSLWVTIAPQITATQIFRLLSGIGLYYALVNWTTSAGRLHLLARGTITGAFLLALSAPFTVIWASRGKLTFIPEPLYPHLPLLVSHPANPNVIAGDLVILLPLALAWLLFRWHELSIIERLTTGTGILIIMVMVVLTQSRGALGALAVALTILLTLYWHRGWLVVVAAAVVATGVVASVGVTPVVNALTANASLGGLANREEIWSRALAIIQDFPFTGIGMGMFEDFTTRVYPLFLSPRGQPHAHNLFLQVAVDLGIPGLLAWLAILLLNMRAAWQLFVYGRATKRSGTAGLGAGLLCAQAALVVHGLTDTLTWGMERSAVLVWLLWGLAMAGRKLFLEAETALSR